jgi:hypothetical protein
MVAKVAGVQNAITHGLFGISRSRVLREVADESGGFNRPCRGLTFASENFCESRFAGTVSTYQPDLVTLINSEDNVLHQDTSSDTDL